MVHTAPLRGLRYNATRVNLSEVLAPPYDVIKPQERDVMARHPYNMVRLILNPDPDPYASAAAHLKAWQEQGILAPDSEPAYYVHYQTYTHPESGQRLTRKGVLARIKAEAFSVSGVRPHEKTLVGPKADRLNLTEATACNFSPVFGLMPDTDNALLAWMEQMAGETPEWDFEFDHCQHRFWPVYDETQIARLTSLCHSRHVLIADGHHRYETAVAYAQRHAEQAESQYTLITLVPMSDPGLLVLPTHRLVTGLHADAWKPRLAALRSHFDCMPCPDFAALEKNLHHCDPQRLAFGVYSSGQCCELWIWKKGVSIAQTSGHALEDPLVEKLDLAVLHQVIFEHGLGISAEHQSQQTYLKYFKHLNEARDLADHFPEYLLFVTRAVSLQLIDSLAERGICMPQKSTYFYPKLPSGLVMHAHNLQSEASADKLRKAYR